ncbi:hypothetical protein G5I_00734 [Acromyrmex echinatior]|uniref:Uncharacterized protein n=1 Tax=Acromyrmex echinatior TaxID=103372 RepID=F4W5N6_ACREC|nr:hypothetical protein G5I_00734 [Acromyrmex echinatior]
MQKGWVSSVYEVKHTETVIYSNVQPRSPLLFQASLLAHPTSFKRTTKQRGTLSSVNNPAFIVSGLRETVDLANVRDISLQLVGRLVGWQLLQGETGVGLVGVGHCCERTIGPREDKRTHSQRSVVKIEPFFVRTLRSTRLETYDSSEKGERHRYDIATYICSKIHDRSSDILRAPVGNTPQKIVTSKELNERLLFEKRRRARRLWRQEREQDSCDIKHHQAIRDLTRRIRNIRISSGRRDTSVKIAGENPSKYSIKLRSPRSRLRSPLTHPTSRDPATRTRRTHRREKSRASVSARTTLPRWEIEGRRRRPDTRLLLGTSRASGTSGSRDSDGQTAMTRAAPPTINRAREPDPTDAAERRRGGDGPRFYRG